MPPAESASPGQRLAYVLLGILLFAGIAALVWFATSTGTRLGGLDYGLIGGCGAGGAYLIGFAALGRKVKWK